MWVWLAAAIAAEVSATVGLRFSQGFSKLGPSVVVVLGYGFAFWALSQALRRGLAVGVAYGVWSAIGVAALAIIGAVFLGEPLSWVQVGGIALVVLGVVALEMGGSHVAA